MKKTNIYKIFIVVLSCSWLATTFTSCRFEDEDFFDESAALRIEHAADEVQQILTAAPNGWVLQYYCGTGVAQFEGFNLFARFESSNKVTLAGNHRFLRDGNANRYTEAVSVYEMLREDGLVLAFNTWNDVLTPFVDPVDYASAPNTLAKDGEGMQGDHNFVIMSYNDNEIIMRGERHQAEVRLVKCDRTWDEYIAACNDTKNQLTQTLSNFYVIGETDTLYFTGLRNGRFRYCENLTNPVKLDSLACCFTPDGFRLEREDSIGSNKFHEFKMNEEGFLANEDGTVKVLGVWDDYIINHTAIWDMDDSQFTSEQKSLASQIDEEIKKFNTAWVLRSFGIGRSNGRNSVVGLVVTFYTDAAHTESRTNSVGVGLNFNKPAYGQVEIEHLDNNPVDNNMISIKSRATNIEALTRQFAATLNGIYNITPDDYYTPQGGQFTPISGGNPFALR